MNEAQRKLALRQAKGKRQKDYVLELLRGPVRLNMYWGSPVGDSGISYWSRDSLNGRLIDNGFEFKTIKMPSGNNYLALVPPTK